MAAQKSELTAYEVKDGAYGMYLAKDGWSVDVDFGSFVYMKDQVDTLLAKKDAEIVRLKERKSPDIVDALALSPVGKRLVDPAFTKKEPVVDTHEAVAELKDEYCTHCVICGKPWGAGALHMQHRVTFHGRFVTNLYTCLDCNAKISRGEI